MPTFRYAKLVRDKILQMHEQNGDVVTGKSLSQRELAEALQQKLTEESSELFHAISIHNTNQIENELADIYQVLADLAFALGVDEVDVHAAKSQKFSKKGGEFQCIEGVRIGGLEGLHVVVEDDLRSLHEREVGVAPRRVEQIVVQAIDVAQAD